MNWGKGTALALIAFAGLMTWFVIMASRNPEPLVTEQYYEQELKYQDRIERRSRALALSAEVDIRAADGGLRLRFPEEMKGAPIDGRLTLMRPNDPAADRVLDVRIDTSGTFLVQGADLAPGRYNAVLDWSAKGITYCTEDRIVVP